MDVLTAAGSVAGFGVYDENLTYNSSNIATQFPNGNNTGVDSTGNVLTATASDGDAVSLVKTQDGGGANPDFVGITDGTLDGGLPFQGKFEFANISEQVSVSSAKATDDHTSAISSSGTVTRSGTHDTSLDGWKMFDGLAATEWAAPYSFNNMWVSYQFSAAEIVREYDITASPGTPAKTPDSWDIEGSNNGSTWVTVDTITNESAWSAGEKRRYVVSSPGSYIHYKYTATHGETGDPYVAELEYFGESGSSINTLKTTTPIANGDNLVIVKDNDSVNEIVASSVSTIDVNETTTYIPEMTSSVLPAGQVYWSTQGLNGYDEAWGAFNSDSGSFWRTVFGTVVGYITYKHTEAKTVYKYAITGHSQLTATPKNFTLQGSNNNSSWTTLDTRTNETAWSSGEKRAYTVSSPASYLYYKLDVTLNNGHQTDLYVRRLELFPTVQQYTMDTTATTAGEIPSKVYAVDAQPSFAISGGYVDAVKSGDSYVYDANTVVPISILNTYTDGTVLNEPYGFYIDDNTIYVASYSGDYFSSYDVSDPTNIVLLDSITSGSSFNGARDVGVSGSHAFVISQLGQTLTSVNISDPNAMTVTQTLSHSNYNGSLAVEVSGSYAYSLTYLSAILVSSNISNPGNMSKAHTLSLSQVGRELVIAGTVAYVIGATAIISINISNPNAMVVLDTLALVGTYENIALDGNTAYVCGNGYITAINITTPSAMSQISKYTDASLDRGYGIDVDTVTKLAYIARDIDTALTVVDISNSSNMTTVESLVDATNFNYARKVKVSNNGIAYVTAFSGNALSSVNISEEGLATTRTYEELEDATGSQTLQSKVILKAEGDKMTELTASILKRN